MVDIYKQIVELKMISSISRQQKGYVFEQLIREIQPWDFRPPIVAIGISEQLDGIYNWDGKTFIIECKAKEKTILRGTPDWEDFELKIRKRKGSVIGIYCCLNSVDSSVYEAATDLNKEGMTTLILADQFWTNLNEERIDFEIVLNYLIVYARASFKPEQIDVEKIRNWHYNSNETERKINSILINESSTFLRRHKKENHSKLYVRREIDKNILDYARQLKPSALLQKFKTKDIKGTNLTYEQKKEPPVQIFLLRDYSGAGKTFFSTEHTEHHEFFHSFSKAANQTGIDNISEILRKISPDYGIQELITLDKPILYFIDSLDEAIYSQNKHTEIRAAIEFVNSELNLFGQKHNLSAFPFGLVFTIREDYWREWESDFEGRKRFDVKKIISSFNDQEFELALKNYSATYSFNIVNKVDNATKSVLSIPINLAIFSETNEYCGDIEIHNIWEEKLLYGYFNRKKENVAKRGVTGISQELFIKICSDIAYSAIARKANQMHKKEIFAIIQSDYKLFEPLFEDIILLLESESIIISTTENKYLYRFKHNKFIEFLSSYYVLHQLDRKQDITILDSFASDIFESGLASMFKIHDFILFISQKEFPALAGMVENHYANSEKFMTRSLKKLRSDIASGEASGDRVLNMIINKCGSKNPEVTWNSFFVISAKQNHPQAVVLLSSFSNAWDSNSSSEFIWKLLPKMAINGLLISQEVVKRILSCTYAKVWEVFLGLVIEYNLREEFNCLWAEVDTNHILNLKLISDDWEIALKLIGLIINNRKFIKGE